MDMLKQNSMLLVNELKNKDISFTQMCDYLQVLLELNED